MNILKGVTKQLLNLWVKGIRGRRGIKLSEDQIDEISRRLLSLCFSLPKEMNRKPRSLEVLLRLTEIIGIRSILSLCTFFLGVFIFFKTHPPPVSYDFLGYLRLKKDYSKLQVL